MNPYPKLNESDFKKVRRQIHSAAKVIGKFREKLVKPIAKNDNLWLTIVEQGFCTPPMGGLNELEIGCNLEKLIIEIADGRNKYCSVEMNGQTASGLCGKVLDTLSSQFGIKAEVDPAEFDNSKTLEIPTDKANEFLTQFTNNASFIMEFHGSLNEGVKTQLCLWPHHFDYAFKWFSGRKIDEQDEQMGIGFSNGDETYELPYFYLTLWPELRKTNTLLIPEGAILHDHVWTGLILPYDSIIEKNSLQSQQELIRNYLDVSFKSVKRGFSKR